MRKFTTIISSLFLVASVNAASVWKVSDGESSLYLGGTLHLLSASDYPLPEAFDKAFAASETLVFETDIAAMESPQFAQQMMMSMMYRDGTTLSDVLSPATLTQLKAQLAQYGLPFEQMKALKPSLIGITLSAVEFQRLGLNVEGVDKYFFTKGTQESKAIDWLETPMEQVFFIASMGEGKEDEMIKYTLRDLEKLPVALEQMKADWLAGDMQSMYDHSMKDFKQDYPEIYNNLLVTRNNNWMPKILDYMKTPEAEFVLVGALHMAGEAGLIAQLKKAGYTVTKL